MSTDEPYEDSYQQLERALGKLGSTDKERAERIATFQRAAMGMTVAMLSAARGMGALSFIPEASRGPAAAIAEFINAQVPRAAPTDPLGRSCHLALTNLSIKRQSLK